MEGIAVTQIGESVILPSAKTVSGKVHSVFGKCMNLTFNKRGVCLCSPEVAMSPIHMQAEIWKFDKFAEGMEAVLGRKVLAVDNTRFSLETALYYKSPLGAGLRLPPRGALNAGRIIRELYKKYSATQNTLEGFAALPHYIYARFYDKTAAIPVLCGIGANAAQSAGLFADGADTLEISCFYRGIDIMTGLGQGLTPSGDDFLTGMFVMLLNGVKRCRPIISKTANYAAQNAPGRTNQIAAWQLEVAAKGESIEPLDTLCKNILSGDADNACLNIEQVLRVGATSGCDLFAGVFFAAVLLYLYDL